MSPLRVPPDWRLTQLLVINRRFVSVVVWFDSDHRRFHHGHHGGNLRVLSAGLVRHLRREGEGSQGKASTGICSSTCLQQYRLVQLGTFCVP